MPDIDTTTTSPEGDATGSPEGTPDAQAQNTLSEVEQARKRQAGAERARQEAERERDEAKRAYEALVNSKPEDQKPVDTNALIKQAKAELKAEFEAEYAKKAAEAQGAALDARFPAARAKFPEVTDAVKLAELEAFFGEEPEAPRPIANAAGREQTGAKQPDDMTREELKDSFRGMSPAELGFTVAE